MWKSDKQALINYHKSVFFTERPESICGITLYIFLISEPISKKYLLNLLSFPRRNFPERQWILFVWVNNWVNPASGWSCCSAVQTASVGKGQLYQGRVSINAGTDINTVCLCELLVWYKQPFYANIAIVKNVPVIMDVCKHLKWWQL